MSGNAAGMEEGKLPRALKTDYAGNIDRSRPLRVNFSAFPFRAKGE